LQLLMALAGKPYALSCLPAWMAEYLRGNVLPSAGAGGGRGGGIGKKRKRTRDKVSITCYPELKLTLGPETYLVRASPSFRRGKAWRDFCVLEHEGKQVLARVWVLFARPGQEGTQMMSGMCLDYRSSD